MLEKFKFLLEQSSEDLFFKKYVIPILNSLPDKFDSIIKNVLKISKIKLEKENIRVDLEASEIYAKKIHEIIWNFDFGSDFDFTFDIYESPKFNPGYSIITSDKIPYLRFGFSTDIRYLINHEYIKFDNYENDDFEKIIDQINLHDAIPTDFPEISILYFKIRPLALNNGIKIIIIEEIQSTLIGEQSIEVTGRFRNNLIRILKKVIDVLLDKCDIFYIVRRGIPKHQRFLYDWIEEYRCGNPFKNRNFLKLLGIILNLNKRNINVRVNEKYEYLYCLKGNNLISSEIRFFDVFPVMFIKNLVGDLSFVKKEMFIPKEIIFNTFREELERLEKEVFIPANKDDNIEKHLKGALLTVKYSSWTKTIDVITNIEKIIKHFKNNEEINNIKKYTDLEWFVMLDIDILIHPYETKNHIKHSLEQIAYLESKKINSIFDKKWKKIYDGIVNVLQNLKPVAGVSFRSNIDKIESKSSSMYYLNDFHWRIYFGIRFNLIINFYDILRKIGLKF